MRAKWWRQPREGPLIHNNASNLPSNRVTLQIFDGPSVHYYPIGTFCGLALPPPLRSTASTITLEFQSDTVVGGRGFLVEWTAVQESGPPPTITPGQTKQFIPFKPPYIQPHHIKNMHISCYCTIKKISEAKKIATWHLLSN